MVGLNGVNLPDAIMRAAGSFAAMLQSAGVGVSLGGGAEFAGAWSWLIILLAITLVAPNSLDLLRRYRPALLYKPDFPPDPGFALPARIAWRIEGIVWRSTPVWAAATGLILAAGVLALPQVSEFLYYQF